MLISRFEIIKKHKYTFGIGTASLIAGLFVCMGIRQAPQLAVQQFTTISDSYVYEMQSGDSFDQKVTMPSPWSAIAIRYLPNIRTTKDTKVTLTITQDNQLLPAIQATILDKPNFLDGTDFFSDDLWLLFPLPAFNRDYAGLSLTISVKNGGVVLPYDKEGSHDVHLVGLVKTSFAQRLTFSLANHNRLLLTLQLLIILGAIVLIWHIARIARAKSTAKISLTLLFLFALLYTLPLFTNTTLWGQNDWTEVVAHFAAARHALSNGQFPLWNPYFCGGFPAWSNPQTYWSSGMFIFSWITDDVIGTKLAILAYLTLGIGGMYILCRFLKLSPFTSAIASIIFTGNGFMAMHLSVGHLLWLTMAWIPWTIFLCLKSINQPWYIVASAIASLCIFIEGQIYFTIYTFIFLVFLSLVWWWHTGANTVLKRLLLLGILVISLGAVKLFPTLYFMSSITNHFESGAFLPIKSLYTSFFEHDLTLIDPEYGAYVGLVAIVFFIIGLIRALYAKNRLYLGLTGIGAVFLALACLPPELNFLRSVPILADLRTQTRALVIVMFTMSILAAYGLAWLLANIRHRTTRRLIAVIFIIWLAFDYTTVAQPVLNKLFSERPSGSPSNEGFQQATGRLDTAYHAVKAEQGNIDYCPPHLRLWQPKDAIIANNNTSYKGEVYSDNDSTVTLTHFTPNRITLKTGNITKQDTVHINQNYDSGWHSKEVAITPKNGHVSFLISPKDSNKTIYVEYIPRGLYLGLFVSVATVLCLISLAIWFRVR